MHKLIKYKIYPSSIHEGAAFTSNQWIPVDRSPTGRQMHSVSWIHEQEFE